MVPWRWRASAAPRSSICVWCGGRGQSAAPGVPAPCRVGVPSRALALPPTHSPEGPQGLLGGGPGPGPGSRLTPEVRPESHTGVRFARALPWGSFPFSLQRGCWGLGGLLGVRGSGGSWHYDGGGAARRVPTPRHPYSAGVGLSCLRLPLGTPGSDPSPQGLVALAGRVGEAPQAWQVPQSVSQPPRGPEASGQSRPQAEPRFTSGLRRLPVVLLPFRNLVE